MKLSIRVAGLCASGTFILTALPGFYQQIKPTDMTNMATEAIPGLSILETLGISLAGAVAAAVIGYIIGDILSNPKGGGKKQKKGQKAQKAPARQLSAEPALMSEASSPVETIPYGEPASSVMEAAPADEG